MATNTVTLRPGLPRPKQLVRQGLVVAVLLVTGLGLGMLIDTGRTGVPAEAQAAPTDVAAAEHGAFTPLINRDPAVIQKRFNGTTPPNLDPDVAAPEHGAFTPLINRDPAVIQKRFVGTTPPNLDPS